MRIMGTEVFVSIPTFARTKGDESTKQSLKFDLEQRDFYTVHFLSATDEISPQP